MSEVPTMSSVSNEKTTSERPPFDVAWQTIDGLKIRYAAGGNSGERIVLFNPWPESIFAFAPVWSGLVRQFQVLAIDLPGFGRSEGRDDLFSPQTMGDFIVKAIDAFGVKSAHAIGLDVGTPALLFASLARPELFPSLSVGAGAATHPLSVEGTLKWMIEAAPLPPLNAREVIEVPGIDSRVHGTVLRSRGLPRVL
jgi:pimeloyl-ACP methyl ester carboxylesterase